MKTLLRRSLTLLASLFLLGLTTPAWATDFGDSKDVKQVRTIVAGKFGHALNASVSHDWALCTAYMDESDLSVVLHRTSSGWKIAAHDGGAFVQENLKELGVPKADIPSLLKAYQ